MKSSDGATAQVIHWLRQDDTALPDAVARAHDGPTSAHLGEYLTSLISESGTHHAITARLALGPDGLEMVNWAAVAYWLITFGEERVSS